MPRAVKPTLQIIPLWIACLEMSLTIFAQSYAIDWYKVSAGGGTSAGGVYSISGTNSVVISPPAGSLYFRLKQ